MQLKPCLARVIGVFFRPRGGLTVPLLVFAIAGVVAACSGAGEPARDWPPALGLPQSHSATLRLLKNDGFLVGYDIEHRRPAWVAYRVRPLAGYRHLPRPDFVSDPRLPAMPPAPAFRRDGFDRGHLAPNHAISQLYGKRAQRQSFYYSNITAQRSRLNQLVWQRLEEIETDAIAPAVDTLWVMLGPIAADNANVPAAFFRIWLARDESGWSALAFRVPQSVRGDERLDRFIVSIDAIESATGLDFLPGMDNAAQARLETRAAPALTFGFESQACLPARYASRWQGRDGIDLNFARCGDANTRD